MRNFEYPGRSAVYSTQGMAATSHPLSTLAAIDILQSGGNAADAAVAACAVQCVVEPGSTGIGGDCFVLYAPGGGGDIVALNGSGRAPAAATADWYASRGITRIDRQSPHAVTVPGAVDAWARVIEDYGTRPLAELLRRAIVLAREGYPVAPRVSRDWHDQQATLEAFDSARELFLPDGSAPKPGEMHRQPALARTLERIAEGGRDAFYTGEVAEEMVEHLQSLGGLHTLEDFAETQSVYVDPIKSSFRGYDVYECPPNGQGVVALLLLNILAGLRPEGANPLTSSRLHQEIEACRLSYNVRDAVLADPQKASVPVEWILTEDHAAELRAQIDMNGTLRELPPVKAPASQDTVYISIVDKDRNAISFINSIFSSFGSGILVPRSGVLLHNRGTGFTLEAGHPNCIAPRKRPLHTIIPGMLVRDGRVQMPFGVMGGHYQAMGHAHLLTKILDYDLDLQEAIDLPRVFPRPSDGLVKAESSVPATVVEELRALGHNIVKPARPIGGAQAIWIDWKHGVLVGASDPRKDGCAIGY